MLTGGDAPFPRAGGVEDRRAALLLAALRLSRDPEMLPRLEAALALLDDGRRPCAAPSADRRPRGSLRRRVVEALDEEEAAARGAERDAGAEIGAAEAARMRVGLPPPEGTPPEEAAALRAAEQLMARLDRGTAVEPGDATTAGWTVAARLELDRAAARASSHLWALFLHGDRPGDRDERLAFVEAGGAAPEIWGWGEVEAELGRRRAAADAAEVFARGLERADPARRATQRRAASDQDGRGH